MRKAKEYREKFVELYNSGEEIINETTGAVFVAEPDEEFRQCWADTSTRRNFPKYWFISELGNLLSVKKDRIQWLNKNKRPKSNKISYKFMHTTEDGAKIRNIEEHNLVGLVWEVEPFGKAKELLREKGLDAFGISNRNEDVVHGHHKSHDDADNRPRNIRFLTDKTHMLIENCPKHDTDETKKYKFMKTFLETMHTENPNGITVMLSGEIYDTNTGTWSNTGDSDIISVNSIKLTPEGEEAVRGFLNQYSDEE